MLFSRDWIGDYVELPEDAELARRLTAAGLAVEKMEKAGDDLVLDVEVTTNRPDCMNHLGLAREVAVLFDRPLRLPVPALSETEEPSAAVASVTIEDPAGCPRYVARAVRGVRIVPSPPWLQARLQAIGLRPINNVVDVTNYVLWETGQPLHAFDLAKLAAGRPDGPDGIARLIVRRARAGERLVTLDGVDRELTPEVLVIADPQGPVALAGVMGGAPTEVTAETVDVLLESAHFDRRRVRLAARSLSMHTDASHRFERGADPEGCRAAADRAAALLAELAGGTVLAGAVDVRGAVLPLRRGPLSLARLNAFAGVSIPAADVERWLSGLGFELQSTSAGSWEVTVPSWRHYDFEPRRAQGVSEGAEEIYPADLYEEVLRIQGFDAIPATLPAITGTDAPPNPAVVRRGKIRRHLAACGYAESIHFAFMDPAADVAFPSLHPAEPALPAITLANPLSERTSVLRRSLVPNLVESARFNRRRGAAAVRLFEVATVFFGRPEEGPEGGPEVGSTELPDQPEMVGLVCGGVVGTPWSHRTELDLFDLKGVVESLAAELGIEIQARPASLPGILDGTGAEIFAPARPEEVLGWLGQVEADDGAPLYAAELAVAALPATAAVRAIDPPSRFPGIGADLTLTHALTVPWAAIAAAIAELAPPDLVAHGLTGRYRGEGVPDGAVNSTLHFLYNAGDRSLTQEEVNERQLALAQELEHRFGWKG